MKRLIIIGAGPGGYEAAIRFSQRGGEAILIEKGDVGGTCLNRGCIPTKALLHAAQALSDARACAQFTVDGQAFSPAPDIKKIHAFQTAAVEKLRGGVEVLLKANHVRLIKGQAQITAARRVCAGGEALEGDALLIATGSKPFGLRFPGSDLPGVVSSDEILSEASLPRRMLILGGGVIGVEMATAFSGFGTEITLVEAMERLLPMADRELSQSVQMNLRKKGVRVLTGTRLKAVEKTAEADGAPALLCSFEESEETVAADRVLVCVGRAPNTDGLFEDSFRVETERGRILVDEHFETSAPGVFAIGDVSGKIQLAHAASAQGRFVADYLSGFPNDTELSVVPSCVYTNPEIAFVGLSESEARAKGLEIKTSKFLMSANGRTLIAGGERGFFKLVADAKTGELLGAQILGERATDMIDEFSLALANHLTIDAMLRAMRPHPTFTEGAQEALEAFDGLSIHTPPRAAR